MIDIIFHFYGEIFPFLYRKNQTPQKWSMDYNIILFTIDGRYRHPNHYSLLIAIFQPKPLLSIERGRYP